MHIWRAFLTVMVVGTLACSSGEGQTDAQTDTGIPGTDLGRAEDLRASDLAGADQPTPECGDGEWVCSDDARTLRACTDGAWVETDCFADQGFLCWEGQCVAPWQHGSPAWSTCADDPLATPESLAEKAAFYDDIAGRLHIHPELKWVTDVRLKKVEVACPEGVEPPCYDAAVGLDVATWEDVEAFHTGENDGLWSGLYLASQAFRYATTESPEALANIKLLLEGERIRMAITGVPGVFTRQYIPAGVEGIACPANDEAYVVDVEKDDNKWVAIKEDGCAWVVDNETLEWKGTDHCGLEEFAGWCWLDNVSQDEYGGHMLALGSLLLLVDEAEVQAAVRDLLEQVGVHLMENQLTFVDWDGRITEHGWLFPMAMANTPGFLAIESLAWMRMAVEASDREDLRAFYDDCLLQKSGEKKCLDWSLQTATPFTEYFKLTALYNGKEGCLTNFNNVSMLNSAYHGMLMFEHDPDVRPLVQEAFRQEVVEFDGPKSTQHLRNSWYGFTWAATKPLGPQSDGPAYQMVEDAICTLRQFPATQAIPDMDNTELYPHYCDSRLGDSMAEEPIPIAQRCPSTYIFWKNPYIRHKCAAQPWEVRQPGDYLLAYWMGRYYGFIPADL